MHSDIDAAPSKSVLDARLLLFGRDRRPASSPVSASRDGRASVWRREGEQIVTEEARFPGWLFLADASILDPLKPERISRSEFLASLEGGTPELPSAVTVVDLEGAGVYRHLVLTTRMPEVESDGRGVPQAQRRLGDAWPVRSARRRVRSPAGRAVSRPSAAAPISRAWPTTTCAGSSSTWRRPAWTPTATHLHDQHLRDSTGCALLIDTADYDERGLHRALRRDRPRARPGRAGEPQHLRLRPDVPGRSERGRWASTWRSAGTAARRSSYPDVVKVGEKTDSFTRWAIAGREVVDTLHAVRRYGAIVRDMRHQGLKEAARYFGVAVGEPRVRARPGDLGHLPARSGARAPLRPGRRAGGGRAVAAAAADLVRAGADGARSRTSGSPRRARARG